ncbi:MAG TPA: energy transducer TonB [Terriglobales bacterium]|nr:energy transducer TonB [Terriglobales bacterium]
MAVATATLRPRVRSGPAMRRAPLPYGGLVLSALLHGALVAVILFAGHVWRTTQPKTYVVNLVPAVAAVGTPQGRTRPPEPTLPRVTEPTAPARPTPPPALPEREPARAPERTRPTDLPERAPAPRESVALPDRSLPSRAPALPRPGEKELPRVASAPPPSTPAGPPGRTPPAPPPPRGLPTGSAQGLGAVTLSGGDFPFAWYLRQVEGKIAEKWDAQARDGSQPQVVFEIARDGKVTALKVEKSSGNALYDQAALRAITEAAPFPPLPQDFKESLIRVHLGFNYAGTRG